MRIVQEGMVCDDMKILFVHQNFPAQFGKLANWLNLQKEHEVFFLTRKQEVEYANIRKVIFKEHRGISDACHKYVKPIEKAVLQGQAAYRSAQILKKQGFVPDVIFGHSGFGATLYLKDVFPRSSFVGFFEWYYHAHGSDVDFDQNHRPTADDECRVRTRNMMILPDLVACNAGVTPTQWQHQQFPKDFSAKLQVIHDGIDTRYFSPQPKAKVKLDSIGLDLSEAEEVVTYVGRGMESYRGFPQFMEAISLLMKRRKNCHVVIVGEDRIAYGVPRSDGKGLKEEMLKAFPYDFQRLHFTGGLAYNDYLKVLQASTVHVYLTYPFVLSWSMLEAMSCGCALVASKTPPVLEVVQDGENGLLADFFNPQAIAERIETVLSDADLRARLGRAARDTICSRYDISAMLPQQFLVLQNAARRK